ncbi:MAG: low-specificity L-threonine aldolase [Bacteroidota bacterium]
MIDLRSDTVTKPTPQMLEAMMKAKVGDDVYEEDETVNALQVHAAKLFGKEAALFCPSGTMTNQIAIKVHTQPGDELICADNAHVYKYEGGGVAFNSGVQIKQLMGDHGRISAKQVEESINTNDVHFPATRLVCLENTSNRGGGSMYSLADMKQMATICKQYNLQLHLDGARIFNAIVASDYDAAQVGECFDSLSICLSKGLGAPVGSLVLGTKTFIVKAKRVRKVFGGGMRQAGFLAAAGLYALEHHVDRLMEDHLKAKYVGDTLSKLSWVKSVMPVETNIVIVQTHYPEEADRIQADLKQQGILCGRISPDQLRMVFHLDVSNEQTDVLVNCLKSI